MTPANQPLDSNHTALQQSWEQILGASRNMQTLAQNADWPAIGELATARHRQINEHFQRFPVAPQNAPFYHQHLAHFLAEEKSLQNLAVAARKQVMRDSLNANKSRRAVHAYSTTKK